MTKQECRAYFRQKRNGLSPGMLASYSEQICDLLFQTLNLQDKTVSIFLPIERNKEVNTYLIIEKALSIGAKIAIPKSNFQTNELKHYLYEGSEQLALSEYGIPEPKGGKIVQVQKIDIVVVPLLGIDQKGYRVGYGKGFYDRFLKKCNPNTKFIGLHLFELIDSIEDQEKHDIPLDICITPTKVFRFERA